jgi:hypothetical protein
MDKLISKLPTKKTYFGSETLSRLELFRKMIEKVNWIGGLIGSDIYSKNYSPFNFLWFWMLFTLFGFGTLNIYSLYIYRKDLERFCFCLVTLASIFQGLPKLYVFFYRLPENLDLIAKIEHFITDYDTKEINAIFDKWMVNSCHISIVLFVTINSSAILVFFYPAIFYLFKKEFILHFGFGLPLVDWKTPFGYFLNYAFVTNAIFFFCCAITSSVIDTINYIVMSFGQFELLNHLVGELNKLILTNKNDSNYNEIKDMIRMIAQSHNKLLE